MLDWWEVSKRDRMTSILRVAFRIDKEREGKSIESMHKVPIFSNIVCVHD